MNYNTQRKKLAIPEYGRNIQGLVDYAMTIEDREKRNSFVNIIINAMAQVNPSVKETSNYKHKLWDHLFIMSDYKLDVDSPFPKPIPEEVESKPERLNYKSSFIRFRPYGKIIENMIDKIIDMPEGEEKNTLIEMIAQHLKKSYLQWNVSSCDDEMILSHFEQLSHGKLKLHEDFKLHSTKKLLSDHSMQRNKNHTQQNQGKKKANNKQKNKTA
ncbi:MAG: DUF4290 domain-containing protein [Bacteroidales bacterium]|nr:DUF4290 domain-containing protein [Bacteroidales bacterium]